MTRYHMNTETGRVNICRSEQGRCPFSVLLHADTKEKVREEFERQMKQDEVYSMKKKAADEKATHPKTAGEVVMEPWLNYLKEKIAHSRTERKQREFMQGDYSRAVAYARGKHAPEENTPKEQSLDSYIDYLKEKLPSRPGQHYKEQEASQAEYARIVAFARGRNLTTR